MRHPAAVVQVLACGLAAMLVHATAQAEWVVPEEAPVDRLLANANAYVAAHLDDPRGYFVLGRINSYAYVLNTTHLRAGYNDDELGQKLPNVNTNPEIQRGPDPGDATKRPTDDVRRKHLIDAISNYRKAIELWPTSGLAKLGLAYVLDVGAADAATIGLPPGDDTHQPTATQRKAAEGAVKGLLQLEERLRQAAEDKLTATLDQSILVILEYHDRDNPQLKAATTRLLQLYWREKAIEQYLQAYLSAAPLDAKDKLPNVKSDEDLWDLVSYQAARGYVTLVKARGVRPAEEPRFNQLRAYVEKVRTLAGEMPEHP